MIERQARKYYTLNKLGKLYKLDSIDELGRFLRKHENIASILLSIYDDIRKIFPVEEIKLKVVSDMEVSDTEELFAYIFTRLPAMEAIEKLEKLEYELLLERLSNIRGVFTFNFRFI